MTKGVVFLTPVEQADAKLVAVVLAQAALTVELSERIGFDLDGVEFTVQQRDQIVRFRLTDLTPSRST